MERGTKLFLLIWAAAALVTVGWLTGPERIELILLALIASATISRVDTRTTSAVLVLVYVLPALTGSGRLQADSLRLVWMAAALGAITPDGLQRGWSLPEGWRGPLVCWALVAAVGASIVVCREIDFMPALLMPGAALTLVVEIPPLDVIASVLHVAVVLVLGILWLDWLFGGDVDRKAWVATPLVVAFTLAAAAAVALPGASGRGLFAWRWDRDAYAAATAMLARWPLFGVGVGSFQHVVNGFSTQTVTPGPAWFPRQIVELGFVGSLGWLAWTVNVGRSLTRQLVVSGSWSARVALLSLAVMVFAALTARDAFVMIGVWTVAFWLVSVLGKKGDGPPPLRTRAWMLVFLVVFVHAAGTVAQALHSLRPPIRAQSAGTPFSYGLYPSEPDGSGGAFRWAARRACAVIDVTGPWLTIRFGVNHSDVVVKPVDVKIWMDGGLVVNERLTSTAMIARQVRVPSQDARVVIDTRVDRVVRPTDLGLPDPRELGLQIDWRFVETTDAR